MYKDNDFFLYDDIFVFFNFFLPLLSYTMNINLKNKDYERTCF